MHAALPRLAKEVKEPRSKFRIVRAGGDFALAEGEPELLPIGPRVVGGAFAEAGVDGRVDETHGAGGVGA